MYGNVEVGHMLVSEYVCVQVGEEQRGFVT